MAIGLLLAQREEQRLATDSAETPEPSSEAEPYLAADATKGSDNDASVERDFIPESPIEDNDPKISTAGHDAPPTSSPHERGMRIETFPHPDEWVVEEVVDVGAAIGPPGYGFGATVTDAG